MILSNITTGIFPLFRRRKKHMLDGPGMINTMSWNSFSLSRCDSYAQYNFSFTVQRTDLEHLLTGACRDERGAYTIEDGVRLSGKDVQYLSTLDLGALTDVVPSPGDGMDDLFLLDAPTVTMYVTRLDGTVQEKAVGDDLSIQLYKRFLPYFRKHH